MQGSSQGRRPATRTGPPTGGAAQPLDGVAVTGAPGAPARGLAVQLGPVAAGLVVLGLGSFAFLSIAGRSLGPADFAPVATLWVLFNAAGLAFYQPIEQELARASAERRAMGTGARPVLVRCTVVGLLLTGVLAVAAGLAHAPLAEQAFAGRSALLPLLLLGLLGLLAQHVLRGLFAGDDRFARYGWQVACDGLLRIVLPVGAVLLTAAGLVAAGPVPLALALVAAPLLAAVLTAGRSDRLVRPGPQVGWGELLPPIGALVAAAVLSQLIVNAAPLAAQMLSGPEETDRAGVLIAALVMTRIPLFFFGAVQAAFLPALVRSSTIGDREGFSRQVRSVLLLVAVAAGAFCAGLAIAGPWALQLLYGPDFLAGRGLLVLLGLGAAAYMVAQALAQALIALRAYRSSLAGWAAGSASFLVLLLLPLPLDGRIAVALLGGGGVAMVVMGGLLRRAVRTVRAVPAPVAGAG